MKQRTILSTLLFCALLLAGCGTAAQTPDATPTPAQEAAATPTPTPDPLSTLPYTDGQLYAAAYLGYQAPTDLDFFQQTYFGGRELPVHHISDGDFISSSRATRMRPCACTKTIWSLTPKRSFMSRRTAMPSSSAATSATFFRT